MHVVSLLAFVLNCREVIRMQQPFHPGFHYRVGFQLHPSSPALFPCNLKVKKNLVSTLAGSSLARSILSDNLGKPEQVLWRYKASALVLQLLLSSCYLMLLYPLLAAHPVTELYHVRIANRWWVLPFQWHLPGLDADTVRTSPQGT